MIKAECHSDDYAVEVSFDATPWFESASREELLELARCEYGGDYPADYLAADMAADYSHEGVTEMFAHLAVMSHGREFVGYECHVDPEDAEKWLARNRPAVFWVIGKEAIARCENRRPA